jgi:hypothetical protein
LTTLVIRGCYNGFSRTYATRILLLTHQTSIRYVSDTGSHPIWCRCVSDTPCGVSNYLIYFDRRIRSLIFPDTSWIHLDMSPIYPDTSWICLDMSPIRPDTSLIRPDISPMHPLHFGYNLISFFLYFIHF